MKHFKTMKYSKDFQETILADGEYKGYKFVIVNRGWHPCAYLEDKGREFSCHGGVTYYGRGNWNGADDTLYYGWDYAHSEDYSGGGFNKHGKKWSTRKIYKEIKKIVDQLTKDE